jgi:PmbA protein
MNNAERMELARWASGFARRKGATHTAVNISRSRSVEIEVREQKTEIIKESISNSLNLQIYRDNKFSSHNTNNLNKQQLEKFISETVAATAYLSADPDRQLPDPSLYPSTLTPDLKIYDNAHERVTPEFRIDQAMKTEQTVRDQYRDVVSAATSFNDYIVESVKVQSNGFEGEKTETYFTLGGNLSVKDKDSRPSGWFYASSRFLNQLPSTQQVADKLLFETIRQLGQKQAPTGKYTMLVENSSAPNLLWHYFSAMQARNLQQRSSFLLDKLNTQIGSDHFTIIDDPLLPSGLASTPFDNEGIASRRRTMIEKGILKEYYINNYYGLKLGMTPNGGSFSNIIVPAGTRSPEQIIATLDKAILVTGFNGGNANTTTGDYSFGIQGQLIEKGKITRPVNEMNISGNFMTLWNNLLETASDTYTYSSFLSPTMMFKDVDFSGA